MCHMKIRHIKICHICCENVPQPASLSLRHPSLYSAVDSHWPADSIAPTSDHIAAASLMRQN